MAFENLINYDAIRALIVRLYAALGDPKIYSSTHTPAGGGTGFVNVQPADTNKIWIFETLSAYHTDTGNNRTITIYKFVGASYAGVYSESMAPDLVNFPVAAKLNIPVVIASQGAYWRLEVNSLTNTKSLAVRGSYWEISDLSRYIS